ncbi:hypothetical protein Mapa_007909 [Marchantia paleacea]|nr:hypothetical protein Mapa_007909 [Marchantia paleacea]
MQYTTTKYLETTGRHEVPRMLYSIQQMKELQDYIDKSGDPPLQRWWAHFCEANNLLPQAIHYYTVVLQQAGDVTSLVRVYCFKSDFSTAAALVLESSDAAAAFSLARQYEKSGQIRQAIKFFSKAGKFTYAARLAMKHNIDNELLALSLQSTKEMMTKAAKYYEEQKKYEEAVLLYHKGGDLEKAINVCFRTRLYDALKAIAEDLDKNEDPALLAKCGDFLLANKQIDKAVQLFIAAKQYVVALDLCMIEGVILTDKMAEAMNLEDQKSEESILLLHKTAEVFNAQGSYHLACKKYTQAGDRLAAMKALLKSGDTERIIFFANVSRHKQIYILAANYLQSLEWHHDGSIMRTIIQLYSKAGDVDALASFYESCAQIEIDEYRDYEKALGAMTEALKYFTNSKSPDKDEQSQSLKSRISEVEQFVQIRRMAKGEPAGLVQACSELLTQLTKSATSTQASVRIGDLHALLIEFYFNQGSMEQAFHVIEIMRARRIALGPFVDQSVLLSIYQALGLEATDDDLADTVGEEIISA